MKFRIAKFTQSFLMLTFVLLANPTLHAATVWSQKDPSAINIYFVQEDIKLALSNGGSNIAPYVYETAQDSWVVWLNKQAEIGSQLRYQQVYANGALGFGGIVPTGLQDVYTPSVAVDSETGRVWVVWSVFESNTENLYASFADSDQWVSALQITSEPALEDTLPTLQVIDSKQIEVNWVRGDTLSRKSFSMVLKEYDWNAAASNLKGSVSKAQERNAKVISAKANLNSPQYREIIALNSNPQVISGSVHLVNGNPQRFINN